MNNYNSFFFSLALSFAFCSCNDDVENLLSSVPADQCSSDLSWCADADVVLLSATRSEAGEDMLSFRDMRTYQRVLGELSQMNDDELLQWESSFGFRSLFHLASDVNDRLEAVNSRRDYDLLRREYGRYFIFNVSDSTDYSFYMPVRYPFSAVTLSPEGNVCIGGQIRNMTVSAVPVELCPEFCTKKIQILTSIESSSSVPDVSVVNGVNMAEVHADGSQLKAVYSETASQGSMFFSAVRPFLDGFIQCRADFYARRDNRITHHLGRRMSPWLTSDPFLTDSSLLHIWSDITGEANRAFMRITKRNLNNHIKY